jgi:hypothetical protein
MGAAHPKNRDEAPTYRESYRRPKKIPRVVEILCGVMESEQSHPTFASQEELLEFVRHRQLRLYAALHDDAVQSGDQRNLAEARQMMALTHRSFNALRRGNREESARVRQSREHVLMARQNRERRELGLSSLPIPAPVPRRPLAPCSRVRPRTPGAKPIKRQGSRRTTSPTRGSPDDPDGDPEPPAPAPGAERHKELGGTAPGLGSSARQPRGARISAGARVRLSPGSATGVVEVVRDHGVAEVTWDTGARCLVPSDWLVEFKQGLRLEIVCSRCGKAFVAQRRTARYCSNACRQQAKRARAAARHAKHRPTGSTGSVVDAAETAPWGLK